MTSPQKPILIIVVLLLIIILSALWYLGYFSVSPANPSATNNSTTQFTTTSSLKGVIQLQTPSAGQEITSPLQVTGFVYANKGTVTIALAQKDSQVVVVEKTAPITGASDQIQFAESLLFALPAVPQTGLLTVAFKDKSGEGLDDQVTIEVEFPSDLGSGL